ncbi:MAG: L-fuculose kinase, partial [Aestuariibacter sp.]|nr:L-fuculose kinase [Aestuariibacter sp.]
MPKAADYSSLVSQQNWRHLMPTMRNAWDCLGQVSAGVAEETGLPVDCNIYAGVHDSNASFLRCL